jgi:hypothetical protein
VLGASFTATSAGTYVKLTPFNGISESGILGADNMAGFPLGRQIMANATDNPDTTSLFFARHRRRMLVSLRARPSHAVRGALVLAATLVLAAGGNAAAATSTFITAGPAGDGGVAGWGRDSIPQTAGSTDPGGAGASYVLIGADRDGAAEQVGEPGPALGEEARRLAPVPWMLDPLFVAITDEGYHYVSAAFPRSSRLGVFTGGGSVSRLATSFYGGPVVEPSMLGLLNLIDAAAPTRAAGLMWGSLITATTQFLLTGFGVLFAPMPAPDPDDIATHEELVTFQRVSQARIHDNLDAVVRRPDVELIADPP